MAFLSKQVNKLTGHYFRVSEFSIPSAGAGVTSAGLTTDVNSVLSGVTDEFGNDLQNTYLGDASTQGLACGLDLALEVRYSSSQDPIIDSVTESSVGVVISRKNYSSGIGINFSVDFVSNGCVANAVANVVRYTDSTTTLDFSSDGGSNFGTGVDISGMTTNDCCILYNSDSSCFLMLRLTGALPSTDSTDTLTVVDTNYSIGFVSYDSGERVAYYNDETVDVDFLIPVVCHWSTLTAEDMLVEKSVGFLDIVHGGIDKYVVQRMDPTGTNTLPLLSSVPSSVTKVTLECNGEDLIYSDHFTITGQTITLIPSGIGYNLETTDKCVAKYFRL